MQRSPFRFRLVASTLITLLMAVWQTGFFDTSCGGATKAAERPANRPNVVLLIADDLGYGELGCQGNPEIPTPAIDSLAAAGARFTQAYVTASYCSSSRAGLMTGRYQTRFGYEFNPIGADNEDPLAGLPGSEKTIATVLHDLGYVTGLVGKWHLGGTARNHPHRRGFDEFFGFLHEGHYYLPPPYRGSLTMVRRRALPNGEAGRYRSGSMIYSTHMGHDEPAYDANNPILRGGQPVVEEEYLTDALTREACDFIDRNREHPFFLTLAYNAVHSPLQATHEDLEQLDFIDNVHRRIFAAMLLRMDRSVATVLEKLAEHNLERDTLVIFLSDNGGPTRELTSSNAPLRGEKGSLYEGGIRIPFIIRWPGRIAPQVCDQPIWSLDIFATLAGITSADIRRDRLDGLNLMDAVDRDGAIGVLEPRGFYWRMNHKVAYPRGSLEAGRNSSCRRGGRVGVVPSRRRSQRDSQPGRHSPRTGRTTREALAGHQSRDDRSDLVSLAVSPDLTPFLQRHRNVPAPIGIAEIRATTSCVRWIGVIGR